MGISSIDFHISVLQILAKNGEMTGKDLCAAIEKKHKCSISFGAFYVRMRPLVEAGEIVARRDEEDIKHFSIGPIDRGQKLQELLDTKRRTNRGDEGVGDLSPA